MHVSSNFTNTTSSSAGATGSGRQPGLIVTLDDAGLLSLSYLGTRPPAAAVTSHVRDLNYDQIDAEHRSLLQVHIYNVIQL